MNKTAAPTAPASAGATLENRVEAWRKLALLALEAATNRPVEFSTADRSAFIGRMRETLGSLGDQAAASQILIAAGSAAEAINHYNAQTQRGFDGLIDRFRALSRTLAGRWPAPLKERFESAFTIEELPRLEEKLSECLELANAAPQLEGPPHVDSTTLPAADPCTGLPMRSEAEAAIRRATVASGQTYVMAFYIHRMNLINARFGDAIGNQVVLFCSQHIATNLSGACDALFRWRGPGFVAVIERNDSPLTVTGDLQRFAAVPLSRFFETPSRTVYLPIKLTAEVFPAAGKDYEELVEQVNKSFHAQGAEGSG